MMKTAVWACLLVSITGTSALAVNKGLDTPSHDVYATLDPLCLRVRLLTDLIRTSVCGTIVESPRSVQPPVVRRRHDDRVTRLAQDVRGDLQCDSGAGHNDQVLWIYRARCSPAEVVRQLAAKGRASGGT